MSTPSLTPLLTAIRKRCKSGLWSKGVTLARDGGVAIESQTAEEIVLRVRSPGRPVAPTVVLYPGEPEWECDCPSQFSPCEHVAAAAIVLGEPKVGDGETDGETTAAPLAVVPAPSLGAQVGYRFTRDADGLRLARVLLSAEGEAPLVGTLRAKLANPAEAARLQLDDVDLRVDDLMEVSGGGSRIALAPTKLDALLRILAGAPRITVDGVPVAVAEDEVFPHVTLTDASGAGGPEVRMTMAADPRVRAVPAAGVALCEEDDGRSTLHRLAETELTGIRLERLPARRAFAAGQLGELLTVVLPDLGKRAVIDVRSRRLPPVVRDLAPRIVLQMDQVEGGGLSVMPTLVYGSPPCARIDAGKLVYLRGPVPLRDTAAERHAIERLRAQLDLLPGRRTTFAGADAPRFVDKLKRWRGDLSGRAAGIVKPTMTLAARLSRRHRSGDRSGALRSDVRPRGTGRRRQIRGEGRRGRRRARLAGGARASCRSPTVAGPPCRSPGCRSTASGSPICWPRATTTASWPVTRCRRWARCAPSWSTPTARPRSAGAAGRGLRQDARGAAPRRSDRDAARLPAAGRRLAGLPAQRGPGRRARRRHGPRQDAAGDVRRSRRPDAGRRAPPACSSTGRPSSRGSARR